MITLFCKYYLYTTCFEDIYKYKIKTKSVCISMHMCVYKVYVCKFTHDSLAIITLDTITNKKQIMISLIAHGK